MSVDQEEATTVIKTAKPGRTAARLDGRPATYRAWAIEYYERDISLAAVEHVYRRRPLTRELVGKLNPELPLADLATDINKIGYPR